MDTSDLPKDGRLVGTSPFTRRSYAVPSDPSGSTDKIRMIVMGPESGSDGALDPRNLTGAPSLWRE